MMGHSGHSVLSNIGLFADKKYKWGDQGVFGGNTLLDNNPADICYADGFWARIRL